MHQTKTHGGEKWNTLKAHSSQRQANEICRYNTTVTTLKNKNQFLLSYDLYELRP